MQYQQTSRFLKLKTPLGTDVLLLEGFSGSEGMSSPFHFELLIVSERLEITAKEIVGANITVELSLKDDDTRYFNGFVSSFVASRMVMQGLRQYRALVVPWTWFLKRSVDCRVFQNKDVKQIIQEVAEKQGFTDFDLSRVKGEHPRREYCVQYQESDFGFISRLMEEEGIFYWFSHSDGKHTLNLADYRGAYENCQEYDVIFSPGTLAVGYLGSWEREHEFTTGRWSHTDYNFKTPQTNLLTNEKSVIKIPLIDKYEVFEYPGTYAKKDAGKTLVRVRMEEEEIRYDVVTAESSCRTFFAGGKFKVSKHESTSEENQEYLITHVDHHITAQSFITGVERDEQYKNTLKCIPASFTFRPRRQTVKPRIHGVQTAVVVGPKNEEIYTDEDGYGRVRVQFHWDRYGKKDENSSCWIRVAQSLAGRKWGEFCLPRIGQEVVVTFLEGDPDRPLIIGAVYNASNMPPVALPDYKTMSGIKTDSSKGGGGFNSVRFDDKKGNEQVIIHAEKDQDIRVKNDCFEWIGRDRHCIVKRDEYRHIQNDHHELIDQNFLIKIGGKWNLKVGGSETIQVGGDVTEVFGSSHSEQTSNEYYLKATNVIIEATAGITLKCGAGSVVIDPSGVTVTGGIVTIDGGLVKIASGPGSPPASGVPSSSSPTSPQKAEEADTWEPGKGRRKT